MLLKMEFGKIWNTKILLIIAVMGLLFGFLFLEFPLNFFPNGHPAKEQYQMMFDWMKKYGAEMDDMEYKDALERLKIELGVADEMTDNLTLISFAAESEPYLQQWAGALYEYELRYKSQSKNLQEQVYTSAEQVRIKDIIQNKKRDGILPYEIIGNATEYWRWVSVFIVLSVIILLAPTVTKDTLTGVYKLQYTSKRGKKILKTQFFATVLSAISLVILEVIIFSILYAKLGTWHFWNNPINSFFYGDIYWFDLSFGQYLLFMLLSVTLFAGGAVGITFFFSCFSQNYISLMLKIIPAFLLLGMLSNNCISYLFTFDNLFYKLIGMKGIEIYVSVIVLLIGIVFTFITLKLQSRILE